MKQRTGKECKKTTCENYQYYSHWGRNLGRSELMVCMECRNSHVSQFVKVRKYIDK
jgi:hypothetical protein